MNQSKYGAYRSVYASSVGFIPDTNIDIFQKEGYAVDAMVWGRPTPKAVAAVAMPLGFLRLNKIPRGSEHPDLISMIEFIQREVSNGTMFEAIRPMNHFDRPIF